MALLFVSDASTSSDRVNALTMTSPEFSSDNPTCLQLDFSSVADRFVVRLSCMPVERSIPVDWVIYRTTLNLGYLTSRLLLDIPASSPTYSGCSVNFDISTSNSGTAAVFNDVKLLPETCYNAFFGFCNIDLFSLAACLKGS